MKKSLILVLISLIMFLSGCHRPAETSNIDILLRNRPRQISEENALVLIKLAMKGEPAGIKIKEKRSCFYSPALLPQQKIYTYEEWAAPIDITGYYPSWTTYFSEGKIGKPEIAINFIVYSMILSLFVAFFILLLDKRNRVDGDFAILYFIFSIIAYCIFTLAYFNYRGEYFGMVLLFGIIQSLLILSLIFLINFIKNVIGTNMKNSLVRKRDQLKA